MIQIASRYYRYHCHYLMCLVLLASLGCGTKTDPAQPAARQAETAGITQAADSTAPGAVNPLCQQGLIPQPDRLLANGWGLNSSNTRYQPNSDINAANAGRLELLWAYAFPGFGGRQGHISVTEHAVIVSDAKRGIYALERNSGCAIWHFQADNQIAGGNLLAEAQGGQVVLFGDQSANLYALRLADGSLLWKTPLATHILSKISSSPVVANGKVIVGISSTEVAFASSTGRKCCTSRGSVAAVDINDGHVLWQHYSIEQEPVYSAERDSFGPSGASIWSTPAVDGAAQRVYVGTSQNYSLPYTDTSDAILALDLNSGERLWHYQGSQGDAWNMACLNQPPRDRNCPKPAGQDHDFGASPVLLAREQGGRMLLAAQKSGVIHALDADSGKLLWQQRLGSGGNFGGIHWGIAVQGTQLFAPITDLQIAKRYDAEKQQFVAALHAELVADARPGLYALDSRDGHLLWEKHWHYTGPDGVQRPALVSAAITLTNELLAVAELNGRVQLLDRRNGDSLWSYDTRGPVVDVNGETGHGGTLDVGGPVIAADMLFVNSGYRKFGVDPAWFGGPGNLLLAFRLKP